MTQEEKMLLIKDLSARLPYAVTVEHTSGFRGTLHDIAIHHMYDDNDNVYDAICYTDFFGDEDSIYIEYFKPYLFPLSSMTEEIMDEIYATTGVYDISINSSVHIEVGTTFEDLTKIFDILHKYHIDYQGLIEKGLALDATDMNVY
jgi:hypothetical protein